MFLTALTAVLCISASSSACIIKPGIADEVITSYQVLPTLLESFSPNEPVNVSGKHLLKVVREGAKPNIYCDVYDTYDACHGKAGNFRLKHYLSVSLPSCIPMH